MELGKSVLFSINVDRNDDLGLGRKRATSSVHKWKWEVVTPHHILDYIPDTYWSSSRYPVNGGYLTIRRRPYK